MHILMTDDPDENAENSIRLFYLWWIFILILIPNYDFYQHNTEKWEFSCSTQSSRYDMVDCSKIPKGWIIRKVNKMSLNVDFNENIWNIFQWKLPYQWKSSRIV